MRGGVGLLGSKGEGDGEFGLCFTTFMRAVLTKNFTVSDKGISWLSRYVRLFFSHSSRKYLDRKRQIYILMITDHCYLSCSILIRMNNASKV